MDELTNQVQSSLEAEFLLGKIQRKYAGDRNTLAEIAAASFRLLMELRIGRADIWQIRIDDPEPGTYEIRDFPLRVSFRRINDDRLVVIGWDEFPMEYEPPDPPSDKG